jgi:uncharacterized alkaline shock family protein YloU
MSGDNGRRLPCGVELGALIDQVAQGLPAERSGHQETCPDCQTALRELEQLWGVVREVAREEIVRPPGLVESVVRRIRRELRALGQLLPLESVVPGLVRHALLTGPGGVTRIAETVVARLVARAVRETPGVHALSVRGVIGVSDGSPGWLAARGITVTGDGQRVDVEIRIVIEYGVQIAVVSARVRDRVVRLIERLTGLEPGVIDIAVEDVYGVPASPEPRRVRLSDHPRL